MAKRADTLSLIEAAYQPSESREAWAKKILSVLLDLGGGTSCGALLFDATNPRWVNVDWAGTEAIPDAFVGSLLNLPMPGDDGSMLVNVYRTLTFASVRESFVPIEPRIGSLLDGFGQQDFGVVGATDPTFRGLLCAITPPPHGFSPRTRYLWRRIAAHLSAGLRLQRTLAALPAAASQLDSAEAVLSPAGRIEHAVGEATLADSREALQDALVRIAAARDMRDDQPFRAADLWTGLCAGRWSLVEHFEKDGRRYFLAHRNDPRLAATRALSERERQVFTYAAMGRSNKLIAYSLGLAVSTVAAHLERARRKLGGGAGLDALQALVPIAAECGAGPEEGDPSKAT
jgi:DNA-binding CsgD family transcriptional regulator